LWKEESMTSSELRKRFDRAEWREYYTADDIERGVYEYEEIAYDAITALKAAEQQAERLAEALDTTLDQIRTFRIWFEDDYTRFVDLPDDDPLLEETARLGLIGRAETTLDEYREKYPEG
jgi:hypothetical protein